MTYKLTCSIVLYHNPINELRIAIESFLNFTGSKKLFLIDNSSDDSRRFEFIHPDIKYIFNGKNIGYGSAHNIAIQKIIGLSRYHLILNPDVEFDAEVLNQLYGFMQKRTDVGLIMPKVLYRNGEMQHLCKMLPSPVDLFLRRCAPNYLKKMFKNQLDAYELKHNDYNSIMEIPNLSGCFMFIRNEVLSEIGCFDERYFLYLEDTDFCRRINEKFRTVYYPLATIIHGYSKASYRSVHLMRHHIFSSVKYFNKWGWFNDKKRLIINKRLLDKNKENTWKHISEITKSQNRESRYLAYKN